MKKILIVDDDPSVRRSLLNLLSAEDYLPMAYSSGEEFLAEELTSLGADIVLLDYRMPGLSGVEVLVQLNLAGNQLPVICMSAHWDEISKRTAIINGAVLCLRKPFTSEELLLAIERHTKLSDDPS